MMSFDDIELLQSEAVGRAVEEHLDGDPLRIALDRRIPHAALVATQVKYLQRARTKLPSYYAARCLLPPLSFEQASSERAAAHKRHSGGVCIDLTCGLGVDSYFLSKQFAQVIAVERDPVLARLAEVNFSRLGAENIRVVNASAEEFLVSESGLHADLVYADPDRRGADGRKLVCVGDCSPDMATLLPRLREVAPRIVVKLSPLFDVDEAFRVFGPQAVVEVVSLGGECKEVLVECGNAVERAAIRATALLPAGETSAEYPRAAPAGSPAAEPSRTPDEFRWLVVPDVAWAKARIARRYYTEKGLYIVSDGAFAFADSLPGGIPGKVFEIERAEPYVPKRWKKELKAEGIRRLNILKRDFPLAAPAVARELGVAEGGERHAAFLRACGGLWALLLK